MKKSRSGSRHFRRAFTLVEMLVVISIIAILAALLLPAIGVAKTRAQVTRARLEIEQLKQAITSYHSQYSRYPVSAGVMTAATTAGDDFTYGGVFQNNVKVTTSNTSGVVQTNDEVVAILMDLQTYPSNSLPTVNANHVKNPQQNKFLNAKMVDNANLGGVGPDLKYRDPWGNPYVISMDLNYDDKCYDSFYRLLKVSQQSGGSGYNGLSNPNYATTPDNFACNDGVMVWSAGPDGSIDPTLPSNVGVNKDNILSWK